MKFIDKNLQNKIACDTSNSGLGAMLEQLYDTVWYPIVFTSRSLIAAEQKFSQMEKETLPILFSGDKVQKYLYGVHFLIENNHKQLVSIF